jgi:hypothetical protein
MNHLDKLQKISCHVQNKPGKINNFFSKQLDYSI